MSEIRHLAKAPIREAVIDIQVTPPVSLEMLKAISDHLADKPHKAEQVWLEAFGFQINKDGGSSSNTNRNPFGYRLTFENEPYVLLCHLNGFTFSRLPPYKDWPEMSATAKMFWEIFLEIAKPEAVSRIAVRYINSMAIPLPIMDFADYLESPPTIPKDLPQTIASFLQRFVIVDSPTDKVAVVTQVLEEQLPESKDKTIILDIDSSKTFEGIAPDTDAIWPVLEELRDFKNRVFFKFLTDKAIRMFE
jgi:uncharacterized protein (TIGR04255 family)